MAKAKYESIPYNLRTAENNRNREKHKDDEKAAMRRRDADDAEIKNILIEGGRQLEQRALAPFNDPKIIESLTKPFTDFEVDFSDLTVTPPSPAASESGI